MAFLCVCVFTWTLPSCLYSPPLPLSLSIAALFIQIPQCGFLSFPLPVSSFPPVEFLLCDSVLC